MGVRQRFFRKAFKALHASGLSRALAPLTQGCGAIFMLHHVRDPSSAAFRPNQHLEVTPEFLTSAIERIRSNGYEIVSLDETVDQLKSGYGRKRYAAITFDDGYRDNAEIAMPILKKLGVPFTIFVSSGLVDRTADLWWIGLERIIAKVDELQLATGPASGTGISCRTTQEKEICFEKLCYWLTHEVSEREQREIIRRLCEQYDVDLRAICDELMMTWDELRALSDEPLVSLGAHTDGHFALARLEEDEARRQIFLSVERMRHELGRSPKHFAYPYGNTVAVSPRDGQLAAEAGFASAVTTMPGVLRSASARNPMMLPRVSLNGRFQDPYIIDQYLTGAPFALYKATRWAFPTDAIKSGVSRLFPSTR
ncbi:Peptidoglycan/xylan/chitin deacetylase, PgdA/CDA1 family [Roseibium suaedae]|uniref:Chitooligosaccharide deacetylase n=2 Tax=Roseibium suaedae TaxID=735517 RepID=A0A1M7CZL9_9HYPH|nr:Peptidoglycan/xylan/chitin deacetylase, PgdA/CDA1 family [Roseibium suaedae]